jgi:hypothetical protein
MNGTQKFTYLVDIDVASAEAAAKKLQQLYQQALAQIKMPTDSGQGIVAAMQAQQSQMSAAAKAGASERVAAAQAETAAKISEANEASQAVVAVERRTTEEVKSEVTRRAAEARRASQSSVRLGGEVIPGMGNVQSLLNTSIAGIGVGYAVQQGLQFMTEANQLATAYNRQQVAALSLAGSQAQLNALMRAYDEATGGAIDQATELAQVTKLQTLGFADSAKELERFVRGARGASLAMGSNADYIVGQAQLAISNTTTNRLDQIGIGVGEFKDKMDELKAANEGASESALYQEAILTIWEEKFGKISESSAAAATGVERLGKAWTDFKLAAGQSEWFNQSAGNIADMVNYVSKEQTRQDTKYSYNISAQRDELKGNDLGFSADELAKQTTRLDQYSAAVEMQTKLTKEGVEGGRQYAQALSDLADDMGRTGSIGDQWQMTLDMITQRYSELSSGTQQVEEDTRQYAEVVGGVITKADALAAGYGSLSAATDAYNAIQGQANITMQETAHWMSVIAGGQSYLNVPGKGFTAVQGPQLPGEDYLKKLSITSGGGFLTPGGGATSDIMSDWQTKWQHENEQATKKGIADREAADKKAASAWEAAAKKTQADMERAANAMAKEFESALHDIPGLFAPSDVTADDMKAAEGGYYQEKADEYLRRLMDEAGGGKDYANVDVKDAARAIGMDENSAPMAIANAFKQAWASGSLWSDPTNIEKFVNKDAVVRDLEERQRGQQGQNNLLNWLGLDPRIVAAAGFQGVLPGRLGGEVPADWMMNTTSGGAGKGDWSQASEQMQAGLGKGADSGLQQFGLDAVTTISNAMTGEQAQKQWDTLGESVGQMMTTAIETGIGQTDLVGVITGAVLAQINAVLDQTP